MGPTVEARSGRGAVASGAGTTVVVGATTVGGGTIIVASVATVASVVAVVATVATTSWVAEQRHHVLHLHKESSFAGGDGGLAMVNDGVRDGRRTSRSSGSSIGIWNRGESVKKTLSNQIGDGIG
jgi:hypothetical protein